MKEGDLVIGVQGLRKGVTGRIRSIFTEFVNGQTIEKARVDWYSVGGCSTILIENIKPRMEKS